VGLILLPFESLVYKRVSGPWGNYSTSKAWQERSGLSAGLGWEVVGRKPWGQGGAGGRRGVRAVSEWRPEEICWGNSGEGASRSESQGGNFSCVAICQAARCMAKGETGSAVVSLYILFH